eukprot:3780556-Pleurochrysis_carterae.AAC.2
MAAISDLGESNQLATTIPGSHLRVVKASPIVLEQRSLSAEERQFHRAPSGAIRGWSARVEPKQDSGTPVASAGCARIGHCVDLLRPADSEPIRITGSFGPISTPDGRYSGSAISAQRYPHPSRGIVRRAHGRATTAKV